MRAKRQNGSRGARRPIRLKRVYEGVEPADGLHDLLDGLRPRGLSRRTPITFLFAARDEARNNAVVLREILDNQEEIR